MKKTSNRSEAFPETENSSEIDFVVSSACDLQKGISELEVVISDRNSAIKNLRIEKKGEYFLVFVQLTWREGEYFLATARAFKKPREFKDFARLVEYIEKTYPSINRFEVIIKK